MKGEGEREREKERPPLTPSPTSGRRKRPPFFPSFARGLLVVLCIWTRAPPNHPDLLPRHLFLSLSPSDPSAGFAERAREARVLPVPIVSCMINDRVDLSPSPAAYASFRAPRWLDRSRGRRCETHEERGGIFGVTKGKLEKIEWKQQ